MVKDGGVGDQIDIEIKWWRWFGGTRGGDLFESVRVTT